jgi:hypothetical protein
VEFKELGGTNLVAGVLEVSIVADGLDHFPNVAKGYHPRQHLSAFLEKLVAGLPHSYHI